MRNEALGGACQTGGLVYCPIISLTYIYDERYVMRHEDSIMTKIAKCKEALGTLH
jgi:hypothetical protein